MLEWIFIPRNEDQNLQRLYVYFFKAINNIIKSILSEAFEILVPISYHRISTAGFYLKAADFKLTTCY